MTELMDLLIEYEALQHHLHIVCYETDLAEYKPDEGQESVSVVEHFSETKEQLSIPHQGQKITFSGCFCKAPGEPVSYEDMDLASVSGNALLIYFHHVDLQDAVEPGVFNQIMGQILDTGMSRIVEQRKQKESEDLKNWQDKMSQLHDRKIKKTEYEISDAQETIDNLKAQVRAEYRKIDDLTDLLKFRKGFTDMAWKRRAEEQYQNLKSLVPESYQSLSFTETGIEAHTHHIDLEHEGSLYSIGRFVVSINLEEGDIRFKNLNGSIDGHGHPHLDDTGHPCWGNLDDVATRLIGQSDYHGLLSIANDLLHSYNEENPFLRIQRWDPEYSEEEEDNERYERCYDASSWTECVRCSDRGCPYSEDAESRCRENADYPDDCIHCGIDCSNHSDALADCQDNRIDAPERCVTCNIRDCHYAGKKQLCFDVHKGERCSDCNSEDCEYRPEETEEVSDEAAVG